MRTAPAKTLTSGISAVKRKPGRAVFWVDLIALSAASLDSSDRQLAVSHNLSRDGVIMGFLEELDAKLGSYLAEKSVLLNEQNLGSVCGEFVREFVRLKTIIQCRDTHATGGYFSDAEQEMVRQWRDIIFPMIKDLDFSCVLELAPGHGRNTAKLCELAGEIHLVDVNVSCLDACRTRFGEVQGNCKFFYHVTDGKSLATIRGSTISLVYSFDSMVHFDKLVVRDYVSEIARVLAPGGAAFLHHSNYGSFSPDSDWAHNVGTRSDMSAELMRQYAAENSLEVAFQRLSGTADGWGMDDLDCFTILRRPEALTS